MSDTTFTIRSVPENLHHTWKVLSSLKSVSMRIYILRALRSQVTKDLDGMKQDSILRERKLEAV